MPKYLLPKPENNDESSLDLLQAMKKMIADEVARQDRNRPDSGSRQLSQEGRTLFSVKELCTRLSDGEVLSESTVRGYIRKGKIIPICTGVKGRKLYTISQIEEFLRSRKQKKEKPQNSRAYRSGKMTFNRVYSQMRKETKL